MLRYSLPTLAALALCAVLHAQTPQPAAPSPLQRSTAVSIPNELIESVSALDSNSAAWQVLKGVDQVQILDLPLGPYRTVAVDLRRIDPFSNDAVIVEVSQDPKGRAIEKVLPKPDSIYLIGTIAGDPNSRVLLTQSIVGVHGYVQDATGQYVISSGPFGGAQTVVSYRLQDLPKGALQWQPWICDAIPTDAHQSQGPEGGIAGDLPCRQMKIAVDSDFEFTNFLFANNSAASTAYAGVLFAAVYEIYQRDLSIIPLVSYLRVWNANIDPYGTAPDSGSQLEEFRGYWLENMESVSRNTAHFLSPRGLGGGVAYMSALCGNYAYGVSGNMGGTFPYPLLDHSFANWDPMVVSHEIGHNLGAPHTHNHCPPADECPPSQYFGACQSQQVCINTGTLMSYCHLCDGGMSNIMLNFHSKSVESINGFMSSLGGPCDLTGTAQPPFTLNDTYNVARGYPNILDVMANEVAGNCESATIGEHMEISNHGGTVTVLAGAGPGGRDLLQYFSAPSYTGPDSFWYRLIDSSGQLSSYTLVTLTVYAWRSPDYPLGDVSGVDANYYALNNPTVVPDYSNLTPYLNVAETQVNYAATNGNFANSGLSNNVGARWTGWVTVDQPGFYTFYTNSDDGSILRIGTQNIVVMNGLQGMTERGGTLGLLPGKHAITVDYFEAGGSAGCIVSLAGPGIAKAPIAASRITRGGTSNPYDLNHDGAVDGADLGMLLGVWGTSTASADPNHDGVVDGADLGGLLGNWTG